MLSPSLTLTVVRATVTDTSLTLTRLNLLKQPEKPEADIRLIYAGSATTSNM